MSLSSATMHSDKIRVSAPKIENRQFVKPLLCGPGPCDYWPSVAEAVLEDIRAGLQYVFQTQSKLVLAMSGAGHAGMEAVINNLVAPGETLLIAARGIWDQRAEIIAKRLGIKVEVTRVPMNTTFNLEQIETELKRLRPAALFITHGDSSTGTVQKMDGLGQLCHKYGALLLVDTVVSLCGHPFFMDEEKINNRKHEPSFYFDVKLLAKQWNCYGDTRIYHHTMSPPMLWALRACLQEISNTTLPVVWARNAASTAHFHKRLQDHGFEFFVPKPEERLTTVTTVALPKGIDYLKFTTVLREKHNILILEGRGANGGQSPKGGHHGSERKNRENIVDMSSHKFIVAPPRIEDREVVKPLLCGPGPCDYWPSVEKALSKPVLSPICEELFKVLEDIRISLQYAFQTRSKLVMATSGSGHSGMEAIISNLVGPGETLLIASRGIWDQRALVIATRYGIKVEVVSTPMDTTFSLAQLEPELKRIRPAALFITHGDSSTGTLQNLEGLGDLCHKYGALLLADTVVSLGGVPFFMDEWGVDGVYTSTQKVFSGPAGISPIAFSARAEHKINSRKHNPPFYLDAKQLAQQWSCDGVTRTTAHFHKRLREYSFEFLIPKPEDRLVTVTTVKLPKGYDYKQFVKYMRENHNILIFAGLGPTVDKALRIGIMGVNSTTKVADAVADAMADTLRALKKSSL
ncbi:hypothetical protein SFRURICE_014244 [Spodoptera frugiperda]|nr:hypothetical protein SFRURICE_014244 [Spodoptera frugiperda]